jgi:hypothetical protein
VQRKNIMPNYIQENESLEQQMEGLKVALQNISNILRDAPYPLSEPHRPIDVLVKFKQAVTSVVGIDLIRATLDANFPNDLRSLLLRRFWLGQESLLTAWDSQLMQNQICSAFYDVLDYIDGVQSKTDVMHQTTSTDITQAMAAIICRRNEKQNVRSLLQWFGYGLTSMYECEPNIINQLRVSLHIIKQKGERRFHVSAFDKNYEVYGAWCLKEGSKPTFELYELLNSYIGYENLHLHKIHDDSQLKKTASLLQHFKKMVVRAGGKELLLPNGPEMADFVTRPYVKDAVTPGMFVH